MEYWFLSAGGLMAAITALHVFAGGSAIARPLLNAKDLHPVPKYTQYYCWHLVSIVLAVMAIGFLAVGFDPSQNGLAIAMVALAASFAVWGLVLPPSVGQSFMNMPQGWLFVPVTILGGLGLAI